MTLLAAGAGIVGAAVSTTLATRTLPNAAQATCAATPTTFLNGATQWHRLQPPFTGLDFTFEWSPSFQVYELLLRNRYDKDMRFTLSAWMKGPPRRLIFVRPWSLSRHAREWPPGVSVTTQRGTMVCVAIHDVAVDLRGHEPSAYDGPWGVLD